MEENREREDTRKIKVLSLGFGQSNFLGQLYGDLKQREANLEFDIDGFAKLHASVDNNEGFAFSHIWDFKSAIKLSTTQKLSLLVQILSNKFFYSHLIHILLHSNARFRAVKQLAYKSIVAKAVGEKYLVPGPHDILHFHFCAPDSLIYLYFLPAPLSKKVICSFWGSDLLRYQGVLNYFLQEQALKRADIITTHSPELREVILAKFGRALKPRIRYALFSLEERLYDLMDKYRPDAAAIQAFKTKTGLTTACTVVVGHNANHHNNHIEILKQLNSYDEALRSQLTCVLPLTYGSVDASYLGRLEEFCAGIAIKCVLIKDFLPWEEVALLRLASDIMIHMPESDALSGAATEAMYAGNYLITGTWLPYSPFRRKGLQYAELDEFSQIPEQVARYVKGEAGLSGEAAMLNRRRIREAFFPAATAQSWIKIYRELAKGST